MATETHNMSDSAARGTQAVDRAAGLIALVVHADEAPSLTELTAETGLTRSTASRLLAALERTHLLERDSDGGYHPGPLFALHAATHDPWPQAVRVAAPILEAVRAATRETVHLGVPRAGTVDHVAQLDSTYLLGSRDWTRLEVPPHCSALGKVLYAHGAIPMPRDPLELRTPSTVADTLALSNQLAEIRSKGFAVTIDELEEGLTAIAAPVYGPESRVVAALGISGPTPRLQDRVDHIGRLLIEQADVLSVLLRRKTNKEGAA